MIDNDNDTNTRTENESEAGARVDEMKTGWDKELQAHPDLGGKNLDQTKAQCRAALVKYGSPELTEFHDLTGIGSHPAQVAAWAKVGADLGESTLAGSGGTVPAAKPKTEKDAAREMYPESYEEMAGNK